MPTLKTITFGDINADEDFRYRCQADREDTIKRLATDISTNGLLTPLMVQEAKNGSYLLVAGFRRYSAISSMDKTDAKRFDAVSAHVYPANTDGFTLLQARFSENFERKSLSPMDIAFAALKLQTQDKLKLADIKSLLRLGSEKTVQRHLRLTKAPKAIQQAVNVGTLTPTAALAIMEAGDNKAMLDIYKQAVADYDPDDPDSRPWSVQRIRKAVDELGKKGGTGDIGRTKQLKDAGIIVRRQGDGYRLSFDVQSIRSLKQLAGRLAKLSDSVGKLTSSTD